MSTVQPHDLSVGVDASSTVPPYEQLRGEILRQAADGTLPAGARLPTVRALAEQLGLAANTVARAYRELEADGVIETRGRHGSFVSVRGDEPHRQAQLAANGFAERMRHLGIPVEEALEMVRAALR